MADGEPVDEALAAGETPALDDVDNVLVEFPLSSADARESYYETVFPRPADGLDLLSVNFRQSPEAWLEEWRSLVGDPPDRCGFLRVDDSIPTSTSTRTAGWGPREGTTAIVTAEHPENLMRIGIAIGEYLADHGGPGTVMVFDSVTRLLAYVDIKRAFRLLHLVVGRVSSRDAIGHYHLDPAAHDDRTLATLASLFGAVCTYDDGEWTVRSGRAAAHLGGADRGRDGTANEGS